MPFFRRNEPTDEYALLRQSIQSRGQAKISEAATYVDHYLREISDEAGVHYSHSHSWLVKQLRMFMVMSWDNWFGVLNRIPEGQQLRAEWDALVAMEERFGPHHLVAWWWNNQESLFRPLVANQFVEMRGALVDGLRAGCR
ncbi:hypothetical protein GCM10018962_75660 [Dactylosporangium matsuzakiense]|uniref:Uncharacterized protein n=2 Tax=Dactylosporangium matsuzakiense TaxID=53360 RepID=A0A9W6KXN4_9ACTN|nr:hypothetical protein GCM10017581_102290 [Dactylosporangium matsuzakiense]